MRSTEPSSCISGGSERTAGAHSIFSREKQRLWDMASAEPTSPSGVQGQSPCEREKRKSLNLKALNHLYA